MSYFLVTFDHMKKLTRVEEEVMQYIWELESCTVSKIIEQLDDPKPPHSTISSIVRILEKKGFVDHDAYGRTHVYRPLIARDTYKKKTLASIVRTYFDGSVENLVSFLVDEKEIGLTDLQELLKNEDE